MNVLLPARPCVSLPDGTNSLPSFKEFWKWCFHCTCDWVTRLQRGPKNLASPGKAVAEPGFQDLFCGRWKSLTQKGVPCDKSQIIHQPQIHQKGCMTLEITLWTIHVLRFWLGLLVTLLISYIISHHNPSNVVKCQAGWWFQSLGKIWVRQLGWWHSQYIS